MGCILIKTKEMERLKMILAEATIQFDPTALEDLDPEDCLSLEEVEDLPTEVIGGTSDDELDEFKIVDGYDDSDCDEERGDEAVNLVDTQNWLDLDV